MTTIDDSVLINWIRDNYKSIRFITDPSYDSYGRARTLSKYILMLKTDEPLYSQKDTVAEIWRNLVGKAIIYLKSTDNREKYHDGEDYGVGKIYDFYSAFRKFEPLLYGAQEEIYRDHMAHMLSVFLLGEHVLRNTIGFDEISVDDDKLPNDKIKADEKEAMWCIISLTHDLGVALEQIPIISSGATYILEQHGIIDKQALSFQFPRQPLHDCLIQFISSDLLPNDKLKNRFITHIQSKYYLKFAEALERRDHGVISSLILMKNLVYFLESDFSLDVHRPLKVDDAKQFQIRRNILRAIASHNCGHIYYLTLLQFPFLLTIFDEMHEWSRPRFIDMFTQKTPNTKVFLEDMSKTAIHYKVELSYDDPLLPEERESMKNEACIYFRKKCDKIRMILRSAVDGEKRKPDGRESQLKLTFEVRDKIGEVTYKIIHETPDPDDIKIFEDGKPITWLKLCQKTDKTIKKQKFAILPH